VARVTYLAQSTTHVLSSPTLVFSPRSPVKQDWTHPPATQAHMFERKTSAFFRVVSITLQHLHRNGTSMAASWNSVLPSESPWHCTATRRIIFTLSYDVPRNGSCPLWAGLFRPRSLMRVTSLPLCQHRQRTLSLPATSWYVLRSFCLYWLDSAQVFRFADYLQPQNMTPIFSPLS
jgi:hypothetical protein